MDTDRNLLFAVQTLQSDLIDSMQFLEAVSTWANDKDTGIDQLLVQQGWITSEQRDHVDSVVASTIQAHNGDTRAALADMSDKEVRQTLLTLRNAELAKTVGLQIPAEEQVDVLETTRPQEGFARYEIEEEFNEGGLGKLWLARDKNLKRKVIFKEIRPGKASNRDHRRRFLVEAQVTGQLEHPNIVPVYELGVRPEDDRPFYTMRYVRGRHLKAEIKLQRQNRRSGWANSVEFRKLLSAFIGVCNAIAYAHSRGVIHRDLKPENVMLGAFGEVNLLDWGLAKVLTDDEDPQRSSIRTVDDEEDPTLTRMGAVLGAPAYMSPEQASGEIDLIDTHTDVYGLGSILFEILTGRPPHVGKRAVDVIRRVQKEPTPGARDADSAVPRPLDAICAKAMAREPSERYTSAEALLEDVQRWMADNAVEAYPEPILGRARRWARRNRTVALLSLVVVVALGVLAFTYERQKRQAIDRETQLLGMEIQKGVGGLQVLLQEAVGKDVLYLSEQKSVADILVRVGTQPGPVDVSGDLGVDVTSTFTSFLDNSPAYFQVRLLKEDGQEVVRFEAGPGDDGERNIWPVDPADLQDKGNSPYFKEALALRRGRFYFSEVDLNKEKGEVQCKNGEHVPVIRACAPVYVGPHDARASGVVVINVEFGPLIRFLRKGAEHDTAGQLQYYITNDRGYFLSRHDDPKKIFAFDRCRNCGDDQPLEAEAKFQVSFPELAGLFGDGAGNVGYAICGTGEERRAVHFQKLEFDPGDRSHFLGVAVAVPYDDLLARAASSYESPIYLPLFLAGVLMLVGIVVYQLIAMGRPDTAVA